MTHEQSAVIAVTAAAGAIGSATTQRLVENGYHVVGADINSRRLDRLAQRLRPGSFTPVVGDVSTEEGVGQVIETVGNAAGTNGLAGLANIAGGIVGDVASFYDKDIEDVDPDEWQGTFQLNLQSTYLMTRAAVTLMRKSGAGSIANVASMAYTGTHDQMGNVAYDAAKAGVVALTRSLARSLGPESIRVNAAAPGLTLSRNLADRLPTTMLDRHLAATPLGKVGEPDDVASVLSFLLGEQSGHLTGEIIHVSGGLQ